MVVYNLKICMYRHSQPTTTWALGMLAEGRVVIQNKKTNSTIKTADYISEHLKELTSLARSEQLDRLVYFLEMAQLEAMDIGQQVRVRKGG